VALSLAIAVGIWWNANTVAHIFIHRPFFRVPSANACVAASLTLLMGFPQSLWRDRHLAHHAGAPYRLRASRELVLETALVLALWSGLAAVAPLFFVQIYVPGFLGALLLCAVHGHYEHAAGTTSHYGRIYNLLCLNDGYHVEHHRYPGVRWTDLPACRAGDAHASGWPAPLRWIETTPRAALECLERIVLHSRHLQRLVVRSHARALAPLVSGLQPDARIAIVGGGLFPRTALVLRELLPDARLTIVDANRANLDRARTLVGGDHVAFVHARFDAGDRADHDLVVIPLSFDGDREGIYTRPPARNVIVHDWIWRRRGRGRVVSLALLKRVNLIQDVELSKNARGEPDEPRAPALVLRLFDPSRASGSPRATSRGDKLRIVPSAVDGPQPHGERFGIAGAKS